MLLKETKNWIVDKSTPLGFLYAKIALLSFDVHYFVSQRTYDSERLEIPPHKVYKMYRQHKRILSIVAHPFAFHLGEIFMRSKFASQLRKRIQTAEERDGASAQKHHNQKIHSAYVKIGYANLNYHANKIKQGKTVISTPLILNDPENIQYLRFVLGYLLPIWLEYSDYVLPLYIKARRGDIVAIEKLLRVDKTIIHDPKIASHFEINIRRPNTPKFIRLHNALAYDFYRKYNRQKTKILAAGLMNSISEQVDSKLSKPDIRELYYCLNMDMFGKRLDKDLCDLSEANFRVQVNTATKFWTQIFAKCPDLEVWMKRHEYLAKKFDD